jgi:hypothetical protein
MLKKAGYKMAKIKKGTNQPQAVLDQNKMLRFNNSDKEVTIPWEFSKATAAMYVGLFGISHNSFAVQ